MKTAKFLTALAMASMFVACVEDLAPVENHKQGMDEVVGGEIIGTDVSMNVPAVGAETKFAGGQANWDSEDKLGMGWIVSGTVNVTQEDNLAPTSDVLYANHLFKGNNGVLSSYGNLYKGWHFVYFPYAYMEEVAEMPELANLNPAQTVNLVNEDGKMHPENYAKRFAQKFHVSALHFLTKESLEVEDGYKLREEVDITPVTPLVELIFSIAPAEGSAFATDVNLKEYKIQRIKLAIPGASRFATKANLIPSKLHQYNAAEDVDNKAELKKSFAEAFNFTYVNNMTVDVSEVGYTVGSKAVAIAYTMPYTGDKNLSSFKNNVQIVVSTDKGDFTIKYKAPSAGQELAAWESANNAAIEALIAAYKPDNAATTDVNEGGVMTKWGASNTMKLQLHEDYFGIDWTVADKEEWEAKSELAKAMKLVNPTFELVENANLNLSEVNIPETGVTVKGTGTLTVDKDMSWNEAITLQENVQVAIAAEKTLTVSGTLAPKAIVNNGTIDAQAKAVLANLTNNGEVKVAYGAQVYPVDANSCGIISFVVPENYSRSMIENVTKVGFAPVTGADARNFANVNTLIINGFEVDLHSTTTTPGTEGVDDPYLSTPGTAGSTSVNKPFGEELSNINFVLNNASIKSTESVTSVKNVTMTNSKVANLAIAALAIEGAENTVNATTISNGVTIKDGKNVVKAETITGGVIVKAGEGAISAKTINGDVTINGNYTVVVESLITGAISAKADKIAVKAHEIKGAVNIDSDECTVDAAVLYGGFTTEKGFNVVKVKEGIFNGVNVKAGKGQISAKTIEGGVTISKGNYTVVAEKVAGNIDVTGENYLSEVAVVTGNVTINNTANTGCVLNGNKITGNLTLTGNGFGLDNVTVADVTLKEGSVKVNNTTLKNLNIEKGNANIVDSSIDGTLTNSGTVVINGETTMKNIVNNGSFTSYVEIIVDNVTLNPRSVTTLTSNGVNYDLTIWYKGDYENKDMTLNGAVTKYGYYTEKFLNDITNATPGETVKLAGDAELSTYLAIDKTVRVDLNGKNIKGVQDVFYLKDGATLSIAGEGTVSGNEVVWALSGSNAVIEGGSYKMTNKDEAHALIYSGGGVITIKGGVFESSALNTTMNATHPQYVLLNVKDGSGGSIVVKGGEFKNFNPANNYSEGANTSFVAAGYKVVIKGTNTVATEAHDVTGADVWYQVVAE